MTGLGVIGTVIVIVALGGGGVCRRLVFLRSAWDGWVTRWELAASGLASSGHLGTGFVLLDAVRERCGAVFLIEWLFRLV